MQMNKFLLLGEALNGRSGHEVGRLLLARLYRQQRSEPLPEIRITENGKPYFSDSDLHFSITHTDRHAFCALSRHPIGIDAEETDRKINLGLARKILSPAEKVRFDASQDKCGALLRLWVLKEASVKLTGQGLRGYPNHTDFSPDDPRVSEHAGCLVAVVTDEN